MELDLPWIAAITGAREARRGARIQSLWGGYGELLRVHLEGGPVASAVVKWARPPRAAQEGISDARKRRSYQVEVRWYEAFAPRCPEASRVASLHGARTSEGEWVLVLEDLDAVGFSARRRHLGDRELDACLRWLAAFHARFLGEPGEGLWPSGTYWHLATRAEELAACGDELLLVAGPELDRRLAACPFPTLVHGDAKEANFCFTPDGRAVAAVDFQYVGRGCAMKDLAYLLHGRADEPEDGIPGRHLDAYFGHLGVALRDARSPNDAREVEPSWRALYPAAKADFLRFLAGWGPTRGRLDERSRQFVRRVIQGG